MGIGVHAVLGECVRAQAEPRRDFVEPGAAEESRVVGDVETAELGRDHAGNGETELGDIGRGDVDGVCSRAGSLDPAAESFKPALRARAFEGATEPVGTRAGFASRNAVAASWSWSA